MKKKGTRKAGGGDGDRSKINNIRKDRCIKKFSKEGRMAEVQIKEVRNENPLTWAIQGRIYCYILWLALMPSA
jgi:hypothetical protein